MANILPKNKKDAIRKEYRLRLATIGLLLIAASILIVTVSMLPSYILLTFRENTVQEQINIEKERQEEVDLSQSDILQRAQAQIESATLTSSDQELSSIVRVITESRSNAIAISHLSYGRKDTSISVSGMAATRDDLLSFRDALRQQPLFSAAELPVSSLAKNNRVPFSITLTLAE